MSLPPLTTPPTPSFLSTPTSSGAFTLVPELISANAAQLSALSQQAAGTDAVEVDALHLLGDAPFVGQFCRAAASALHSQRDNVAALSDYATNASSALSHFVAAVTDAEDAGARALQSLTPTSASNMVVDGGA
ncbi:MAG: hypothetical protein Q4E11_06100 [Corynebacterium sp.]|uniref:hypothetical protein n=1 Tax=Corynebacterium sp. TaxID=1720 RepID=UPI0026DBCBA8|nr:hypothetical protein [Corynebacterium sp.]MDO5030141.1 hypothetical protein [Corynebacterium sp.]